MGSGLAVTVVHACRRDARGGSPTAVLDEAPLSEAERRRVPAAVGASHAVFVSPDHRLRFFTAAGELPACGHGTVAALAVIAARSPGLRCEVTLSAGGRSFAGRCFPAGRAGGDSVDRAFANAAATGGDCAAAAASVSSGRGRGSGHGFAAVFDPGPVDARPATAAECGLVLPALGLDPSAAAGPPTIASVGRPRLLVPVAGRGLLAGLAPDRARLRAACDELGLLGCYVHTLPDPGGSAAARMFAPSIGVPEDIANANSTACLAACLAAEGIAAVAVDMGDALGEPATITAVTRPGAGGVRVEVGGVAEITAVRHLA